MISAESHDPFAESHSGDDDRATGRQAGEGPTELRELRALCKLSQAELAKRAGITREAISLLEHGKHKPRATTIRKLLDALEAALIETGSPPLAPPPRVSPIRRARADSLASIARGYHYRGVLRLDKKAYELLAGHGISRGQVDGAVDVLVGDGRATIGVEHGTVTLRLERGRARP